MPSLTERLRRNAGISMVETIIGGFLVLAGIAILSALVDNSLRAKTNATQYSLAVLIASNKMEQMKALSKQEGAYVDLMKFNSVQDEPADLDPSFRVSITVEERQLYSPCRSVELPKAIEDQSILLDSVKKVTVKVSWDNGQESFLINGYLGDLNIGEIDLDVEVVGGNRNVPARGTVELVVTAREVATGREVKDLHYRWYPSHTGGLGTIIDHNRTQSNATYLNEWEGDVRSGECEVTVIARYKRRRIYERVTLTNL